MRLERLIADRNTPRKVVWRSRIVLLSAAGCGTMEIMRRTGISKPTVWRWQARYLEAGVDGLLRDKSRPPGTPPLSAAIKTLVADQDDARDAAGRDPLERALDGARGRHQPHQRNFATTLVSRATAAGKSSSSTATCAALKSGSTSATAWPRYCSSWDRSGRAPRRP